MRPRNMTEEEFVALVKRRDREPVGGGGNAMPAEIATKRRSVSNPAPPPLMLALTGQLVSGKNQVQLLFRNGKVHKYPNKSFTNWRAKAHRELLPQTPGPMMTKPVSLAVEYWPGDARTRDVSGQLDALFHLLVYSKVLKDDGLVHDVVWKRQAMNRKFPKVVMELTVLKERSAHHE